eukprot:6180749-Pleurochrysis_carterae.AAC.1
MHVRTCTRKCTYTASNKHTHAYTHAHAHGHAHANAHRCAHTSMHARMHLWRAGTRASITTKRALLRNVNGARVRTRAQPRARTQKGSRRVRACTCDLHSHSQLACMNARTPPHARPSPDSCEVLMSVRARAQVQAQARASKD